jgi:zinc transport system ATP-binding protein
MVAASQAPGRSGAHDARPASPAPLEFLNVSFGFTSEPVVEDITFKVPAGEFMAILGPNGSGKTTLLKLTLGLLKPAKGQVLIFGQDPSRFRDWRRVGYVPQRTEALQNRFPATVREVVAFGLYRGPGPQQFFRNDQAGELDRAMETAGVLDLARRRVSELSVGQQQRMLLARALVKKPELLLLDEPVAGVDIQGQEEFHSVMRRLNRQQGITVVLVSHDIGAVMREATTCACINCAMVFHGPVHQITSRELSELYGFPVDFLMHDQAHEHPAGAFHDHR